MQVDRLLTLNTLIMHCENLSEWDASTMEDFHSGKKTCY